MSAEPGQPLVFDMVGRTIKVGDTIAYGLMVGRSANLAIYRVDEIVFVPSTGHHRTGVGTHAYGAHLAPKLKATKLRESYEGYGGLSGKPATISMLERALVINETAKAWPKGEYQ